MYKTTVALLLGLMLNVASAADQATDPKAAPGAPNYFDPTTWQHSMQHNMQPGQMMAFNPFHPAGWAMFMDPKTHNKAHAAFTNPANYAQFMTPQFYMQAMNPQNWMAWMNPASYQVFMNPNTYAYWMNPAAHMHAMNPAPYMQFMNPNAYAQFMNPAMYMQWMNPAAMQYGAAGANNGKAEMPANFFDPNAWAKMWAGSMPATVAPAQPQTSDAKTN